VRSRLSLLLVLGVLAAASATGLPSGSASAYNLEGPKWANQAAPGTCCAHVQYHLPLIWSDANDNETGLLNGVAAWNNSPALIWFDLNDRADFSGTMIQLGDTNDSSVGWVGLTSYSYQINGDGSQWFIASVQVYLNGFYTSTYPAGAIQEAAVHELGHAVGLDHNSGCFIMNPSISYWSCGGLDTPTQDEIDGINALY
jgi:predicted Zn-dependent protease